ncbi:RNA pseudouridine synthase [Pigmentiphaga litoralis]|uniref:RNA pseudouridine synthase n=1 Tax=Pigmentiphaga litoralis TaxID=516702 RepID=UPI003B429689
MTDSVRLAKHVAEMAGCSRREAEQLIEGGWVRVDGNVVEEAGFRLAAGQQTDIDPAARPVPVEPVTILWHKPAGLPVNDHGDSALRSLTADTRLPSDRSNLRFLKKHLSNLDVVTPIDAAASGLVVLTQEYRIARKLRDDAPRIEHEYLVEVAGNIVPDGLARLNAGGFYRGKAMPAAKISWQNETRLRVAIKTPPDGLIGHLCAQVGLGVKTIKRLRIGRLPLAGLEPGQWRYLLGYERF